MIDSFKLTLSKLKSRGVFLFLLSTISFFLPLSDSFEKLLTYLSFSLLIIIYIKNRCFTIPKNSWLFIGFLLSVIISVIPAKIYWGQSYIVSIIAILPFSLYGLFIILVGLKINKTDFINFICLLGKIYSIIFIIEILFPLLPIGSIVTDEIRGNRIVIPGEFFNYFLFFSYLNSLLKKKSRSKVFWLILSFVTILLPMTRQRIVVILLLAGIKVIKSVKIKKLFRIFPFIILVVGGVTTPMILRLSQMTNEQMSSDNPYDHIREVGIVYYFTEFPNKGLNYLIGNGIPSYGRSAYGNDSKEFADSTKIYLIDIGFAGIFNYFGLIGLLFYVSICLYYGLKKCCGEYDYCRYFLIFILFSSVLSGVPLIPSQFMFIGICAYIVTPINNYGRKHNHNQLQYTSVSSRLYQEY